MAERIAEELGTELGDAVGYQVRFTDKTSPAGRVKLMTDGILLAELQHDKELRRYDTLIIDEAHERSLNIDFILGYLRQLLPRRPDLKVVITSATIDPERFSQHFADAPIIEVSGRTYPVEVRYRPLVEESYDDDEGEPVVRDQTEAVIDAVRELGREGDGDVLVFLPGEREIRDTEDALKKHLDELDGRSRGSGFDILPLFSRLSAAEQHRVFAQHARRRVVLATNVAETSLTVPGIRYVVDTGVARISRYSLRTKVQRLPIEPISQASANQRAGRCGRVADGIAIRLYSEEDYLSRPEFTDPEILRTNLASVILQMTALGLGDVARFPFVDPPDQRNVRAGVQLLEELGALRTGGSTRNRLTTIGRRLARLPIDPRLGRMILEADRLGCLREVLVVAAALSIQDPRERPLEHRARADQLHARFRDDRSDFMAWLNLWRYLRGEQKERGSSSFRRLCREEHLNYLRVREWQDFESQLRQVARQIGLTPGKHAAEPDDDRIHQALLCRAALAHRPEGGAGVSTRLDRWKERRSAAADGVPRCAWRQVRDLPGLGPGPEAAGLRDGRRAGRDLAPVGPAERRDRPGVGGAAGGAPGQAQLLRAALVAEARRGDGLRTGHLVRRPAGLATGWSASARSTRSWPVSSSSGTRSCTASGTPGSRSSRPTGSSWRRPRSSSTARVGGGSWSTSTHCSTSTTTGSARAS